MQHVRTKVTKAGNETTKSKEMSFMHLLTIMKKLSALLAEKSRKTYSEVCGYVNARMSIAIVRATHLCLRGSRVPTSQISNRRPQWEDGAGMGLFRH